MRRNPYLNDADFERFAVTTLHPKDVEAFIAAA